MQMGVRCEGVKCEGAGGEGGGEGEGTNSLLCHCCAQPALIFSAMASSCLRSSLRASACCACGEYSEE